MGFFLKLHIFKAALRKNAFTRSRVELKKTKQNKIKKNKTNYNTLENTENDVVPRHGLVWR